MIWHDLLFQEIALPLMVEVEETSDQGLEDMRAEGDSGEVGEELDIKDFS